MHKFMLTNQIRYPSPLQGSVHLRLKYLPETAVHLRGYLVSYTDEKHLIKTSLLKPLETF